MIYLNLQVLEGARETLQMCCSLEEQWRRSPLNEDLWSRTLEIVELGNPELLVFALPLINVVVSSLTENVDSEVCLA